ncbi:hypothetical protein [Vibrio parahaemolyticus]|uniref:hypothetical protein n=1 Tax=Vibrio parahaemolyticus TaxID=670 RepID=UPI00081365AA|nr:hypothetical protein [Vibrio parahaemolyticus]OCP68222.1 hypothetical protein AKH08_15505 [Vibrio parahaemolyticus]
MSIKDNLQKMGYEADHLDAVVDRAAQAQASRVNDEGMSEQLRFLEQQGYTQEEIISMIESE